MRILLALTYYAPHVSGLTIYVQRLAAALAARGHQVTVLTSRFDPALPRAEWSDGVRIVRLPVAARISKGVIMPGFSGFASELIQQHDVVSIHLPQLEAGLLTCLSRLAGKPAILTYHCDLLLPPGPFNRMVDEVVYASNRIGGALASAVVAYTQDYADHSRYLRRYPRKLHVIPPPVVMPPPTPDDGAAFREELGLNEAPVVGFAARLAAEKGADVLLNALPLILEELPGLKIVFAGEYRNVLGENVWERLQPVIRRYQSHLRFLGVLPPAAMPRFYAGIDVLTVPSLNSTESFGLVQVEAMLCGTPVVASALPGVREPIRLTGMGEVVPPGDPHALAAALVKVIRQRTNYLRPRAAIAAKFDLAATAAAYERLFARR